MIFELIVALNQKKKTKKWKSGAEDGSSVQRYVPQIDDCDSIVVETAGCLTLWLWDQR
jgi:hypothetical protein